MRQMFMRQILADAISKFQKITRQMLCDKCSKNDVTLIPQTSNGGNITLILKMLKSYGWKILKLLTSLPALYSLLHTNYFRRSIRSCILITSGAIVTG
jgi:hypothetical protein